MVFCSVLCWGHFFLVREQIWIIVAGLVYSIDYVTLILRTLWTENNRWVFTPQNRGSFSSSTSGHFSDQSYDVFATYGSGNIEAFSEKQKMHVLASLPLFIPPFLCSFLPCFHVFFFLNFWTRALLSSPRWPWTCNLYALVSSCCHKKCVPPLHCFPP